MKKIFLIIGLMIFLVGSVLAIAVEQKVTVTVLSVEGLKIHSPVNDEVYSNKRVPFSIELLKEAKYIKYSDNGKRLRTLCRRCDEYGFTKQKRKFFGDGYHEVLIKAIFDFNEIEGSVNFIVDSKDPKILKTEPKRGFAIGEFEVIFKEENPKTLTLNYGNKESGMSEASLDINKECKEYQLNNFEVYCCDYKREKMKCEFKVDLGDYDLEEIEYWFVLEDILGNTDKSRAEDLEVDLSKPVINSFDYTIDGRRVNFVLDIEEKNFDEVNYIDRTDNKARWKKLCTKLKRGKCEKRKMFGKGDHKIDIQVVDEAGNKEEIKDIVFKI